MKNDWKRIFACRISNAQYRLMETRIKELVGNLPELAALVEPLLVVRRVLREQLVILHRRLLAIVRDEVCQRLMTDPLASVLVVVLTYRATVDVPARFRNHVSRCRVWTAVLQVSIRRDRSERQNITLRRRDDAGHALRSSSEHVVVEEMVVAQGLGGAGCQASRD